jgi:hypothetical protein
MKAPSFGKIYLGRNNAHPADHFSTFLIGLVLFRARTPSSFIQEDERLIVSSFIQSRMKDTVGSFIFLSSKVDSD